MVNLSLFRVRSYTLGISIATAYFAGFTGIFFIYTLYLQEGLDYSALLAGLAMTPFALGSAVGSMLGGNVVTRLGRPLIAGGLVLVALGLVLTNVATHLHPGYEVGAWAALPLLIAGFGSGLIISPNQTLTLASVPVRHGGSAGGVLQTGQRVGTAVGIAATSAVFFSTIGSSQDDWALAFRNGLWVIFSFVVLALLLALADVIAGRKQQRY